MYCWSCGKEISDNAKFCPECGVSTVREKTEADKSSKPKKENGKQRKGLIIGVSIIALVAIAVALYFLLGADAFFKKSVMPYGVKWDDSREIVLSKDKDAEIRGENTGKELVCLNQKTNGSFFGVSPTATDMFLIMYKFKDNQLKDINFTISLNNTVITDGAFIDAVTKYYDDRADQYKREGSSIIWLTKGARVEFNYVMNGMFMVEIKPY